MTSRVLNSYANGGTFVTLYADGTKVREVRSSAPPIVPESIDVKITNWCDAACSWCHEKSTKRGIHGDLQKTVDLLKQMPAGAELAIGGGHPLAHPDFDNFVKELSQHGLICNVTINEFHFKKELARIEKLVADGHVHGVGYSYTSVPCDWKYDNLISHIIIGVTPASELEKIIETNNKVLLLGYKNFGRGESFKERSGEGHIDSVINSWYRYLFKAAQIAHLSFDNLAILQLNPKRLFKNPMDYDKFYMGDDGTHTMYIDAVKQEYAVTSTGIARYPLKDLSLKEVFAHVRAN